MSKRVSDEELKAEITCIEVAAMAYDLGIEDVRRGRVALDLRDSRQECADQLKLLVLHAEANTKVEAECADLKREVERLREASVNIYNQGYTTGHHDTVEGCYTDVLPVDMDTYHADVVAYIFAEQALTPAPPCDGFDRTAAHSEVRDNQKLSDAVRDKYPPAKCATCGGSGKKWPKGQWKTVCPDCEEDEDEYETRG